MDKKVLCVLFILILTLIVGCGILNPDTNGNDATSTSSTDANQLLSEDSFTTSFPNSYYKTSGNIEFSIESIDVPNTVEFLEGTACKFNDYNAQSIVEELLPENIDFIYEDDVQGYYIHSGDYSYVACTTMNRVSFHNLRICNYYYNCINDDPKYGNSNLEKYKEEKQFDFGSSDEVLGYIIELLSSYGLVLDDRFVIKTYYLDYETLASEEYAEDMDGNIDYSSYKPDGWSDEDNAYMFYIYEYCQGLPDYHDDGNGWYSYESSMKSVFRIIVNKDGIVEMHQYRDIYDYEIDETMVKLLSFSEITEEVESDLNSIINNETSYVITKACLYVGYDYSNGDLQLIPIWAFRIEETGDFEAEYELNFNAINGDYVDYSINHY